MAVVDQPDTVGLQTIGDFEAALGTWPRGERLEAIRAAGLSFKERFKQGGEILGLRTYDLASAPYPTKMALGGAAVGVNPFVSLQPRMMVIQFEGFDGARKTLVWQPLVPDGSREAPFYKQLSEQMPEWLEKVTVDYRHDVDEAVHLAGLDMDEVDLVAFDHLHVQDMRRLLGTTEAVDGRSEPWPPMFPRGKWICQRKELDTFKSIHPLQWAWYVDGGMDHAIEDNLLAIDDDVLLGKGVALVRTPGHTDGNQSLVINTPDGVWVSSENGVCMDNWQPELSKIPGVRRYAEFFNREVILNSNTLEDASEQYDSMVLERTLADPGRRDPRWLNIFPSSEMASLKRQWPVVPTFSQSDLRYGEIRKPDAAANG
jgi:hypothetical protein